MKITSAQKKFGLPLAGFVISLVAYIKVLGTAWAFLAIVPLFACLMIFLLNNGDRIGKAITDWLNRDGWK